MKKKQLDAFRAAESAAHIAIVCFCSAAILALLVANASGWLQTTESMLMVLSGVGCAWAVFVVGLAVWAFVGVRRLP